jgi:predicted RNA-binding protein YlxR (DUF448 family)
MKVSAGGGPGPTPALRTCVGCRKVRPKSELIRLVVTDGGRRVTLDERGRLPGRGAYLCRDTGAACLRQAVKKRSVSRSLRVGHDVIDDSRLGEELSQLSEEEPPSQR